jgi:probable F420-dependent oxidoreductase
MGVRFGIWLDFRNPARWRQPAARLYRDTLDLAVHAELLGFDDIWTSEHHFVADGYLPSLLVASAAIAARTQRVRIGTNVLLLPFHDPVRVAEDAATVDLISGGRFDLGVAVGYRRSEFEAQGIAYSERGRRMDEAVELLLACWQDAPVRYQGRFYRLVDGRVFPRPVQQPMPLLIAAMSPRAALRAGRWGSGMLGPELLAPSLSDETTVAEAVATFVKAWQERTTAPPDIALGPGFGFVSEDPDRDADVVLPHLAYRRELYVRWFSEAGVSREPTAQPFDAQSFRETYPSILVSPIEARAKIERILEAFPLTTRLYFWAVPPGLAIERAARSLELFAAQVMPWFR